MKEYKNKWDKYNPNGMMIGLNSNISVNNKLNELIDNDDTENICCL